MPAVKTRKNIRDQLVLFAMTGLCSLLMIDTEMKEFPIFSCARMLSETKNGSGIILEHTMREAVPLFGYEIMAEKGVQSPEDETTCRTLTAEELMGEDILLPATEEKEPQIIADTLEAENNNMSDMREFIPAQQQVQIDLAELTDYETLVRNFYAVDANTMAGSDQLAIEKLMNVNMTLEKEGECPQILIYHTHSQEAFADSVPGEVSTGIVGVGDYLTKVLTEQYGYRVLHHTGQYDVETRDNAYSKALPAVEQILAENPSIQVIIDLHRDEVAEGTRLVTELEGRPTAKFMFFNGLSRTRKTGDIDYLKNENQEANLAFSFQMQLKAVEYYPGLTRRIYLKGYRYNMHLRPRTLLVELGAQNNTYEEAKNACDPLAHILDMVLSGE